MLIEACDFGTMTVDGVDYNADLIVYPDKVTPNWWRRQGHRLDAQDLEEVIAAKPEVLVIGNGTAEMMTVPPSTLYALKKAHIRVIIKDTLRAWLLYNEQIEKGAKAVGAFHLTC